MGKNNVAGRQNKCGGGVIMYTYPAWTFGGKRQNDDATAGPGPGQFVLPSTFSTIGPGFGHARRAGQAPQHGPHTPGALPQASRGPAYGFGQLLPAKSNANPGPQDYQQLTWASNTHAGASWGPPPSQRPASVPRPIRMEEPILRKTRGPSFGLAHKAHQPADTPGPNAYHACAGCCIACDSYKGKSFGLRPPSMYERSAMSPGPANYHTECTTIGAATQNCASGSSTFRRNRSA